MNDELREYILNMASNETVSLEIKLKRAILANESDAHTQWIFDTYKNAMQMEEKINDYFSENQHGK